MDNLVFSVKGSSEEPYSVNFYREDGNLYVTCTCSAGQMGQACKHRLQLLAGDPSAIVSPNAEHAKLVISEWLPGTPLHKSLDDLRDAESALEQAKKKLAAVKKHLSSTMRPQP